MWDAVADLWWLGGALALLVLLIYRVVRREVSIVGRELERQARKRGGRVQTSWVHYPRLVFQDDGAEIVVSAFFGSKQGGPSTFAELSIAGLEPGRFRLDPQGAPFRRPPYPVASTGDSSFDDAFAVHTDDEPFIRRLLTPELRTALLQAGGRDRAVRVRVTRPQPGRPEHEGRLWVSIDGIAKTEEEYDRLIDTTILLRRRVGDVVTDLHEA